jgi:hypothetical protein
MGITIRMPFESWISLYCHSSYWLPHVITKHANIQIHFMFVPHVCGLLGVLNILYSQCCGMAAWKLNCLYGHQWNEVLHYAQLLTTSKFILHNNDIILVKLEMYCPIPACIFGKLLGNISNILGHDVKPYDQNIPFSWYSAWIFMSSPSICVVQDVAKIHPSYMLFEFRRLTFTNVLASFR